MKLEPTAIKDVVIITPRRYGDARGYFMETYKKQVLQDEIGFDPGFVQDNFSLSAKKDTIRGLHFQTPPHVQGKLVRCTRGALLDVAVDARIGSPTYKKWVAVKLTAENDKQLWIPGGFLHGFRTLMNDTEITYKCTDYYAPDCDGAVAWDDPDLAIDWGADTDNVTLSDKDLRAQTFAKFNNPFTYES